MLPSLQSKQQKVCSIGELKKVEVLRPKAVTISFERDQSETIAETEQTLPSKWVCGLFVGHYLEPSFLSW